MLAVETEEERRVRLENDAVKTVQFGHGDGRRKKSKTGEDGSYHTAQVGPGDRGKSKKKGMDLIWIEIKNKKIQGMGSLTTIFLVVEVTGQF